MLPPKYAHPVNELHDLNVESRPSTGMYTLFPSLSLTWIVVLDNHFMCCCYHLRTLLFAMGRAVNFWSKKGSQWYSKFVCSLCISVSADLAKPESVVCRWDAAPELVTKYLPIVTPTQLHVSRCNPNDESILQQVIRWWLYRPPC